MNDSAPGRVCPLHYRYGAGSIARAEESEVRTLYVVGGLYGNTPALDTAEALARSESPPAALCFNGDFNWFDVADERFVDINRRVLAHDATLGNVEAELASSTDDAGCGCAYPGAVDAATVERSNTIHRRLKATARRHRALRDRLAQLPMVRRYRVADCRIGVVHGDAESLAGWRFDVKALDDPASRPWLRSAFALAAVDIFASTHTCLPALRSVEVSPGRWGWVVNNGAAGMPNFPGDPAGLCTRIGATPSPHPTLHEVRLAGAFVGLMPLRFDPQRWHDEFLAQWTPGSPAWLSYFDRIVRGPPFTIEKALGLAAAPGGSWTQPVRRSTGSTALQR